MDKLKSLGNDELDKGELIDRRKFLQALLVGGASAALAACGAEKPKSEMIPEATVDQLNAHPEVFTEMPLIKVTGFIEKKGEKKQVDVAAPLITSAGKAVIVIINWRTTRVDTYNLYSDEKKTGKPLPVVVEQIEDSYVSPKDLKEDPRLSPQDGHKTISGRIVKIKDGDREQFVFQLKDVPVMARN